MINIAYFLIGFATAYAFNLVIMMEIKETLRNIDAKYKRLAEILEQWQKQI